MARFDKIFDASETRKKEALPRRETKWIHYTKLTDNPAQYCNERDKDEIIALASLIDADGGVLQNVLVRKTDTDEYEIIAGHKRRRACRYLAEELGKKQYEFLPCTVETLSDVRAEFQLYSSNGYHDMTDYERMHELERMKYLLENYPEEFPNLQTGRMVERLAKRMHMKRTTVGEYLTISKNLGEKAMDAFREGDINKSAALEMSSLSVEEQDTLVEQGATARKEIQAYKEAKIQKHKSEDVPDSGTQEPKANVPDSGTRELKENVPDSGTQEPEANVPDSGTQEPEANVPDFGTQELEANVPDFGTQEAGEIVPDSGTQETGPVKYNRHDVELLQIHWIGELEASKEAGMPESYLKDRQILVDALARMLAGWNE